MRLSQQEVQLLISALNPFLEKKEAELRLFGSRLDNQQKGGDIDLLLLFGSEPHADDMRKQKHYLLAAIKKIIGDQKIDLIIASKKQLQEEAFLKMIFPDSIALHQWS